MLDKPSSCAGCSLYGKSRGFLRPSGPVDADILFVAEAAGAIEAVRGEGLVGDAGGMFNRLLNMKGIARNSVRIHNIVSCQPPNNWLENAPWEEAAIRQCRANLEPVLAEGHKVVVPMGNVALRAVLGLEKARGVKIENFHGTVTRDPSNRYWVVPTFHPSYLQRKARNLIGTVAWDIGVAKRVAKEGFVRDEAQLIVDPTLEWFRAYADAYIAAANKDPWGVWLATDIETPDKQAKEDEDELDAEDRSTIILRINFSYSSDVGITVPWVGPYISIVEEMLATHGVKIFHNKHYDVPRLVFNRIQLNGPIWDSMDAWHALHTNLPKSLGFISPFFSNLGPWKHLASTNPGLYAAYDPVQTFRDMVGIAKELQSEGRWDIYFRHMYMMDAYVLQPASDVGTGANQAALVELQTEIQAASEKIHAELQPLIPDHIKPLHPKDGWAKPPNDDDKIIEESDESDLANEPLSVGSSDIFDDIPDANAQASWDHLLGSGDNALTSAQHQDPSSTGGLRDGIIARKLKRLIQVCITCGDEGVSKVHKCLVGDRNVQLLDREVTRYFRREPFNPASPVQMLAYFEYKGHKPGMNPKTRKPSVDKQVLERVGPKDPVIREIIKVKNLDKIESTYVTPTLNRIGVGDHRIHPSFGHKPNTLRTNSWEPNLQNIPNKEDNELGYRYRSTLEAASGCKMISIDFAGIEAVLTGWFAGDKDYMRLAYLGVHAYVTAQKVGEPADLKWSDEDLLAHFNMIKNKYKKEYKQNKKVVHTSNYLGGAAGIYRSQPEMFASIKEAQALQDFYFEVAPKIKQWQINTVNMAAKQKFLGGPGQHPFGYKFWFWDVLTYERVDIGKYTWLQKQGKMVSRMQDMHFAINLGPDAKPAVACMPQSSAGGEMYETSLRLFVPEEPNYIGDTYFGRTPLRALVHDEYWLEVEDRHVDRVIASAYQEMTRAIPQMGGLVLGASVKVGKNLGSGLEDYKIGGLTGTLASDISVAEEEES